MENLTREGIIALLATNDKAVERALVVLADRQTSDELAGKTTTKRNGRGFNQFDAPIFTDMALSVKRGRRLTPRQLALCRKPNSHGTARIAKYAGQLLEAAIAKQQAKVAPPAPKPVTIQLDGETMQRCGEYEQAGMF